MARSDDEPILTRVGISNDGDHLFCGYSALGELSGATTYSSLLTLALRGRTATPDESSLLDDIASLLCAADGRVWPLKIGRILSSYGKLMPGFSAPTWSMEGSDTIGPWTTLGAANALLEFSRFSGSGDDFVSSRKRLTGWGVALRARDERYEKLTERVAAHGRERGRFWTLHLTLSESIGRIKSIQPNVSAGLAAVMLDLGFSPTQLAAFSVAILTPMLIAHALECAQLQSPRYRRLPTSAIRYVGPAPRELPPLWRGE